nr:MAG TPA: hypothetical protein [Caudoviricetes sp.]
MVRCWLRGFSCLSVMFYLAKEVDVFNNLFKKKKKMLKRNRRHYLMMIIYLLFISCLYI